MYYLELAVVGIVWGCTYAMMALGLTLVYGLLRILHIAHATVFTLGAYVGLLTANATGNLLLAFPAAMLIAGIVGPLIYRLVYEPILGQPPYVALIASIGVLIAMEEGQALGYSLFNLQERGRLFIGHGEEVYEGMIIGIHSRDNDLVVNPVREKKLTNVRASGKDEHIDLVPPIQLTLESAVEFIADDELVEITPQSIRLRKRFLKEHERKRASREAAVAG